MEREDPLAAAAQLVGLLARGVAHAGGQSVEVGLVRNLEHEVVVLGQQVAAEADGHARQLLVNLLEPFLLGRVEQRAAAHEAVVGLLQQAALLGVKAELGAPVIDRLDAGEELLVEQNPVVVGREQRQRLLLDGLHPLVGLGAAEHLEDQPRLGQHLARVVVGQNHVLEGRLVVVLYDGGNLGIVQRHAPLEGRHEVLGADFIEGRCPVGGLPLGEEGILAALLRRAARGERHEKGTHQ